VEECVRLNFALMTMAERFPYVRFVRGVCTDLIPTFDEIGLPTLMLYRGGKKLDILVRVTDELGANFSDKDLVLYLAKCVYLIFSFISDSSQLKRHQLIAV
jgi:hypothetical protein